MLSSLCVEGLLSILGVFFGGCAPEHVIWERKSVDSQVEAHFWARR